MSAKDYYSMAAENLRNVPGLFSGPGTGRLLGRAAASEASQTDPNPKNRHIGHANLK
jgi:hypothetical protein